MPEPASALAFAAACGKDGVEVKDRAGFIVNALLFPYLNDAVRMLEANYASADDIDLAMKKVYCLLPPGIVGSNAYFNDGDGESAFLLFAPFLTTTCSPPFI